MLTDKEKLWWKVDHQRVMELARSDNVTEFHRDSNLYGEFWFITLQRGQTSVQMYGLGWHNSREQYLVDFWEIASIDPIHAEQPPLNKEEVLSQLETLRQKYLEYQTRAAAPSPEAQLWNTLVDNLGDPDSVASFLAEQGV